MRVTVRADVAPYLPAVAAAGTAPRMRVRRFRRIRRWLR